MKERPILFTPENVRKILDGKKTQTRRVVKPQPDSGIRHTVIYSGRPNPTGLEDGHGRALSCPYGVPGDRLWVKETWQPYQGAIYSNYVTANIQYRADEKVKFRTIPDGAIKVGKSYPKEQWQSAMFMPRWAARLILEVAEIRAEPVQAINLKDIVAEGVASSTVENFDDVIHERWVTLWDSINGKTYPWDSNPWVWAITFTVVQP